MSVNTGSCFLMVSPFVNGLSMNAISERTERALIWPVWYIVPR